MSSTNNPFDFPTQVPTHVRICAEPGTTIDHNHQIADLQRRVAALESYIRTLVQILIPQPERANLLQPATFGKCAYCGLDAYKPCMSSMDAGMCGQYASRRR